MSTDGGRPFLNLPKSQYITLFSTCQVQNMKNNRDNRTGTPNRAVPFRGNAAQKPLTGHRCRGQAVSIPKP